MLFRVATDMAKTEDTWVWATILTGGVQQNTGVFLFVPFTAA